MFRPPADRRPLGRGGVPTSSVDPEVVTILRRLMYRLAREQEAVAADQAALVPYWQPCPLSVLGTRAGAQSLREVADALPSILADLTVQRRTDSDTDTESAAVGPTANAIPAA